ncbi:MAG: transcriptional regulator [Nitrospinae bacterium RIFCSPLOWO2_12_39_15]|nr:MAG: transcriptional regulator [Nitrospinae bacterium RIFCSPHIGHO2_12_FULL_39_42]OGW07642.1 MAG: transcriptional regulator [Nitrospinae bacterium RIFCSPLOWO2_12_39_15]
MDKRIYEMHAVICSILSNPKRLEILDLLRDGEKSVNELSGLMDIPQSNLSQHLSLMRQKGILETRRDGVNIYYSIINPKVIKAFDIMREVLLEQISRNEKLIKKIRVVRR